MVNDNAVDPLFGATVTGKNVLDKDRALGTDADTQKEDRLALTPHALSHF